MSLSRCQTRWQFSLCSLLLRSVEKIGLSSVSHKPSASTEQERNASIFRMRQKKVEREKFFEKKKSRERGEKRGERERLKTLRHGLGRMQEGYYYVFFFFLSLPHSNLHLMQLLCGERLSQANARVEPPAGSARPTCTKTSRAGYRGVRNTIQNSNLATNFDSEGNKEQFLER
jgi:hypothetical protein